MSILIEGMEMPDTCTRCDYIGLNVAIGCKVVETSVRRSVQN